MRRIFRRILIEITSGVAASSQRRLNRDLTFLLERNYCLLMHEAAMGGSHEKVVSSQSQSQEARRSARFLTRPASTGGARLAGGAVVAAACASAQVITIDTHGNATTGSSGTVDRRYQQITPTHVPLQQTPLDTKTRLDLIRFLEADQGFAMRPFPRGHKGLTLVANGKLEPAGEPYLNMVTTNGLSRQAGRPPGDDRCQIRRNRGSSSRLNGGPDAKHRFLRHVQIGMDPNMTTLSCRMTAGGPDRRHG